MNCKESTKDFFYRIKKKKQEQALDEYLNVKRVSQKNTSNCDPSLGILAAAYDPIKNSIILVPEFHTYG